VIRFTLPRMLRSPFVLGSAVVHVVLAAAVVLVPTLGSKPGFEDPFLMVSLVDTGPAPKTSAPPAPARPPQPSPKPSEPAPQPTPDEGVRVETTTPKLNEKKKKEPEPAPEPPQPQPQSAPPEAGLGGDEEEMGVVGDDAADVGGGLAGGESDSELAWYRSSVTAALYGNWRRPVLSGLRETLEVTIEFEILRDGNVRDVRVTATSGVPSLDRSALRAVADAAPLPPVPSHWRDSSIPARFVFRLHPEQI
jgi:TonB family protein